MTTPIAVFTSVISGLLPRRHTKLPKQKYEKAVCLHECNDDGLGLLDQLHDDVKSFLKKKRQSMRFFVIVRSTNSKSMRKVRRELKWGCGRKQSVIIFDETINPDMALENLKQALSKLDGVQASNIMLRYEFGKSDSIEAQVSYIGFTLNRPWQQ